MHNWITDLTAWYLRRQWRLQAVVVRITSTDDCRWNWLALFIAQMARVSQDYCRAVRRDGVPHFSWSVTLWKLYLHVTLAQVIVVPRVDGRSVICKSWPIMTDSHWETKHWFCFFCSLCLLVLHLFSGEVRWHGIIAGNRCKKTEKATKVMAQFKQEQAC